MSEHRTFGLSWAMDVHMGMEHVHPWNCDVLRSRVLVSCVDDSVGSRVFV